MRHRIINWLKGKLPSKGSSQGETTKGLVWRRFRNGWISGPYVLMPNLGRGVLAYHQGVFLNDGRMLPDVQAAKSCCKVHYAAQVTMSVA